MVGPKSPPVTATRQGWSATSTGPFSAHSRQAAPSGLPTSRLAADRAKRSIAPERGTPNFRWPGRPRSWMVVRRPGFSTRKTGSAGAAGLLDRVELHPVPRPEQARRIVLGKEHGHRGAA